MRDVPEKLGKYASVLKSICNVDDLHRLRGKEWEGCIGVACVLAFLEGAIPNVHALASHLGFSPYNNHFSTAFIRLKINGVFGDRFGAMKDPLLKGESIVPDNPELVSSQHMAELAWCHIAGIAGGRIGIKNKF